MQNNPFAKFFYDKFQSDVLNKCTYYGENETIPLGDLESRFIERFNRFLTRCGQPQVEVSHHSIPDKKLAQFCADLRFNMVRNVQNIPNVSSQFSHDKDLISLFDSAAQYLINRNLQYRRQGRRVPQLSDVYDYSVWKVSLQDELGRTKMVPSKVPPKPNTCNLFIFDPNRCPQDENVVKKLFRHDMQNLFYGSKYENTKMYFIHMPPSYPEEIAVANVLTTLRYPEEYTEADMTFAQERWGNFLGKNLKYNEDHEIVSGYRYEDQDFIANMKELKILGYCAGTADAHRCLKAFKNLAEQIYEPQVVKQAMKNVQMVSYAMMPLEKNPDYAGVYFMTNDVNNMDNPEHVVMTNFPELYQQIHVTRDDLKTAECKITETAAGDYIVASPLPPTSIQIDKDGKLIDKIKDKNARAQRLSLGTSLSEAKSGKLGKKNERDGHRLQNSTSANLGNPNHIMFKTVVNNALQGKHNAELFRQPVTRNSDYALSPAIAFAQRQKLKD